MGNLVKETPYSEITATLEVLDKLGVERKHLTLIRSDEKQAEQVAEVMRSIPEPLRCKHCGSTRLELAPDGYNGDAADAVDAGGRSYLCRDECYRSWGRPSMMPVWPARAKQIMGQNMLDIADVERHFGVRFSTADDTSLIMVPWSEKVLQECKDTHILFPGYPLTILDIRNKAPKGAFYSYENAWYNNQNFARNKKVNLCWYLIRKQAVKGSFGKSYNEQAQLLNENEEVPMAVEVVYMTILYYLVNNIRLFENYWVRCQDLDSYGFRVSVGFFGRGGLSIFGLYWDGDRVSCVGLAVSRKFQN